MSPTSAATWLQYPSAMNSEKLQFFSQRFLPGRLTANETAWYLGFGEHDIYVLVQYKLLTPLGNPVSNCTKYFLSSGLEKLLVDSRWYDRATALVTHHWRIKNGRPAQPNPLLASYVKIRKPPASSRKSRPKSS